MTNSKFSSTVPDYTKMHADPIFDDFKAKVNEQLQEYVSNLEAVRIRAGYQSAMEVAQLGNLFLVEQGFDNKLITNEPDKAAAVVGIGRLTPPLFYSPTSAEGP